MTDYGNGGTCSLYFMVVLFWQAVPWPTYGPVRHCRGLPPCLLSVLRVGAVRDGDIKFGRIKNEKVTDKNGVCIPGISIIRK